MRNSLVLLCLLVLSGCYSGNSIRVAENSSIAMERERGFVNINPVRMSEVSGEDILLNLDTLLKDEKALEYFEKYKQENRVSYKQRSTKVTGSAGKQLESDEESTDGSTQAADFDSDKFENNDTAISYYDLIEMAANSQMLARSLIRRFSKIKSPSSEHKLYCIPVDITFFPGTVTRENYRADVLLRFRKKANDIDINFSTGKLCVNDCIIDARLRFRKKANKFGKDFKIIAIAPYEYSKISSVLQAKLKELFITVAAKGTIKGASVEGRLDKVIRNFNKLQSTLSRPEITATLIEDDTILFTYWGHSDLNGDSHLMSGETFRCELFVYYKPKLDLDEYCGIDSSAKNIDLKAVSYDYIWQYTPTKDYRWFNPINWYYTWYYPPMPNKDILNSISSESEYKNYRYYKKDNTLWIDNLMNKSSIVSVSYAYLIDSENSTTDNIKTNLGIVKTNLELIKSAANDDNLKDSISKALREIESMEGDTNKLSTSAETLLKETENILREIKEIVKTQKQDGKNNDNKADKKEMDIQKAAELAVATVAKIDSKSKKKLVLKGSGFNILKEKIIKHKKMIKHRKKDNRNILEARLNGREFTIDEHNVNNTTIIADFNGKIENKYAMLIVYLREKTDKKDDKKDSKDGLNLLLAQKIEIKSLQNPENDKSTTAEKESDTETRTVTIVSKIPKSTADSKVNIETTTSVNNK